jgi:DNA invertase Pin-like site-specific DNA recombinase
MTEAHPEKRLIGYARVSTVGQTLDSQLEQLRIFRRFVADAVGVAGPREKIRLIVRSS